MNMGQQLLQPWLPASTIQHDFDTDAVSRFGPCAAYLHEMAIYHEDRSRTEKFTINLVVLHGNAIRVRRHKASTASIVDGHGRDCRHSFELGCYLTENHRIPVKLLADEVTEAMTTDADDQCCLATEVTARDGSICRRAPTEAFCDRH